MSSRKTSEQSSERASFSAYGKQGPANMQGKEMGTKSVGERTTRLSVSCMPPIAWCATHAWHRNMPCAHYFYLPGRIRCRQIPSADVAVRAPTRGGTGAPTRAARRAARRATKRGSTRMVCACEHGMCMVHGRERSLCLSKFSQFLCSSVIGIGPHA